MADLPPAKVTVLFSGLMILRFDSRKEYCEVGIIRNAPDHSCSIIVNKKKGGSTSSTIWRHFGNLEEELWIDVIGLTKSIDTHKFGTDPLNRASPLEDQKQDIRWSLDLTSNEFHKLRPIKLIPERISPGMYLTKGLFYTAVRTDPARVKSIKRIGGDESDLQLYRIASVIGANISYDKAGGFAFLKYGNSDIVPLPAEDADTSYEIIVDNSPLEAQREGHEELKHYYQVIEKVPPSKRFEIAIPPPVTPDVPCMTMFLGTGQ